MYFRTKKNTRIREGKPQIPTKFHIIINESPSKKEEIGPSEGNNQEVTPPQRKTKSHVTSVSGPTTRSVTF